MAPLGRLTATGGAGWSPWACELLVESEGLWFALAWFGAANDGWIEGAAGSVVGIGAGVAVDGPLGGVCAGGGRTGDVGPAGSVAAGGWVGSRRVQPGRIQWGSVRAEPSGWGRPWLRAKISLHRSGSPRCSCATPQRVSLRWTA